MHFRHAAAGTTVIAKRRQEKPMMRHDPDVQDLTARYGTRVLDPVRAPGRHAIAAWALAVAVALAAFLGPPLTRQAVAALLELRHGVLMLDRELERVSVRLAGNALTKDAGSISLGRATASAVAAALSDAVRAVEASVPRDVSFRSLGAHRLQGLPELQPLFQLEAPDLPGDFPAPRTTKGSR
jgi:hypothetical protein